MAMNRVVSLRRSALPPVVLGALVLSCAPAQAQNQGDAAVRADSTLIATDRQRTSEIELAPQASVAIEAPAAQADAATHAAIFIGAISLSGLQSLSPADFSDIVAARIGRTLSPAELKELTEAVAARLRAKGFAFASAWIEPQRLTTGILVVKVDEGRIDEVRFTGPAPAAARRALAALINGKPARLAEVERRLLIAGDIDGVRIGGSRYLREGGKGVLLVDARHDRFQARVAFSNQGTRPIGREQARIEADFNGLFASDDSLTLSYSTAPAQPRELQFGYARYAKRISPAGTELALSGAISVTHPGAYLASFDLRNRSWYVAGSVLAPLLRRRRASFWLEGELGLRELSQWRSGLLIRNDKVATARLTVHGNSALAGGRLRVSTTLTQGLGLLGATRPGDPLASRRDADGTFSTLSAWSDWTTDLGGKFSLRLAAAGQVASQPLLISEETSLGGTAFLRGYDWGERTGDEGVMGLAELRYLIDRPLGLAKRAQLYAFVDGGSLYNLQRGQGGGALASAGGGIRMDVTRNFGATFELAVPLSGPRYDTGDESPKLNFGLVRSF
ncbi:MAG: ShlB/FhaC/HecB family hemolysin secretion/activation protein [Novosphingobium sp.]|nr:MAG: ShlB/FhaC/HecB family hemolysin secretion/activation protein [Novosphingobium sp.]